MHPPQPPPGWQPPPPGQPSWPGFTEHAFQPLPPRAPQVQEFPWRVALGWMVGLGVALVLSFVLLIFISPLLVPLLVVGAAVATWVFLGRGVLDRRADAVGFGIVAAPLFAVAAILLVFGSLARSGL